MDLTEEITFCRGNYAMIMRLYPEVIFDFSNHGTVVGTITDEEDKYLVRDGDILARVVDTNKVLVISIEDEDYHKYEPMVRKETFSRVDDDGVTWRLWKISNGATLEKQPVEADSVEEHFEHLNYISSDIGNANSNISFLHVLEGNGKAILLMFESISKLDSETGQYGAVCGVIPFTQNGGALEPYSAGELPEDTIETLKWFTSVAMKSNTRAEFHAGSKVTKLERKVLH